MVGMSSVLPPARRGPGVRPVRPVAEPTRGTSKPRQPDTNARGPEPEQTAWRHRDQINGETVIDAEFVEILRDATSTAATINPADDTLRQALEAYRRAGSLRSILGAVIDIPT